LMRLMPPVCMVGHVQFATENSNACTMLPGADGFLQLLVLHARVVDGKILHVDLRQVGAIR
jgi:hypothetical protein